MDVRVGAALAALVALLAGCSSPAPGTGSTGTTAATASPTATATATATGLGATDAATVLAALSALEEASEKAMRDKDPAAPLTPALLAAMGAAAASAAPGTEPTVAGVAVTDAAVLPVGSGAEQRPFCVVASRSDEADGTAAAWAVVARPGGRTAVIAGASCADVQPTVAALLPRMDSASPPAPPLAGDAGAWAAGVVLTRPADYDAVVLRPDAAQLTAHGQQYVTGYRSRTAQRLADDAHADANALGRSLEDYARSHGGVYPSKVSATASGGTQTIAWADRSVVLGPGSTLTSLATARARDALCLRVTSGDGQQVVYQSGVGAIGIPPLECPAARFPLSLLG